ncbi:hypothetical protein AAE02nite_18020 [Adhaeribacter aerolatus]|uniref:Cytochrome c domain-containing protein n=1 Tax=Adhaeribacter aerolatus TaxID=670289 RepID=A0A512AWN9_9BACT|nr:PQQ-dependent sugar dehydrogenase [Adhaeribacter aerolatus]GEO04138.1 hypothetical protein AAE02nite_18020 [Adhaeribacter aerolatus]
MGKHLYLFVLTCLQLLFLAGCSPKQTPTVTNSDPAPSTLSGAEQSKVAGQKPTDSVPATSPYASNPQVISQGEALFQNNCATCHNFKQKGIGPNLAGVTAEVSHAWITSFIRNAPAVIASGDVRGKRLFAEFNQYMPPFTGLSNADIQALVSFINTHKKTAPPNVSSAQFGEAIKDPIPTKIPKSNLKLILDEVLTAPATAQKIPLARINKMRVLTGGKKDRHFIQELRGLIYEIEGKKLNVFMDITKERPGFIPQPGLATGFGSFAFHPEFYKNGLFYTTHTEKAQAAPADFAFADSIKVTLQWVLTEWKMKDPYAATFAGTGREMLRVNMMTQVHGVQEITFNPLAKPGSPDYGLLYIGVGDGGSAEGGAYFICNSNKTIWSSVLRIDPKGRNSQNKKYGIPAQNPFAQDNDSQTLGEVYVRGFRNPNRITWSPDGKMLISDIGLNNMEELNLGQAGADYGWPAREGTFLLDYRGKMDRVYALPPDDNKFNYTYPVAQFDHDEGNAFSGGFVYTNPNIPVLKGKYIFGDIVSGRVFFVENSQLKLGQQAPIQEMDLQIAGKRTTLKEIMGGKKTDLRFGLGPKQELYIFTKSDGRIYKVTGCSTKEEI